MFSIPQAISAILSPPRYGVASSVKVYCSCQGDKIQLPITPSEVEVTVQNNNTTLNINDIGEILMIGKSGLLSLTVESFFPNQSYYFADVRYSEKPYDYVDKIMRWKDSGQPMRLLFSGTTINKPFAIESFTHGERDGTGDVYYSLSLREYKYLTEIAGQIDDLTELAERQDERVLDSITIYPGDDIADVAIRAVGATEAIWQCKQMARRNLQPGDVLKVKHGKISL